MREPVRLAFGTHVYAEPIRCLSLLPRLLHLVRQLLKEGVYLHQSRLNPKPGFGGGTGWVRHQNYPPWHSIDVMPEPRCVMASVFIDECTAAKSPLLVVPGSQRHDLLDSNASPRRKRPRLLATPHRSHHVPAAGRGQRNRRVDRTGGVRRFHPLQRAARFGRQCLAVAAGDPLT